MRCPARRSAGGARCCSRARNQRGGQARETRRRSARPRPVQHARAAREGRSAIHMISHGAPCMWMRGGTSKGGYFLGHDLPDDIAARDAFLLRVMGSPDPRQIDGMGGADPLTSKVRSEEHTSELQSLMRISYAVVCLK